MGVTAPERNGMLKSLGRTTVLVRDYDEAAEFYCGRLGCERWQDSIRADGQRLLHLGWPGQPAGQPGLWLLEPATPAERALIGRQTGGQPLCAVYTDDCRGPAAA
jgi:catechol 2,3-dioxygenase-like lactoylglutathione lyase family enzyme